MAGESFRVATTGPVPFESAFEMGPFGQPRYRFEDHGDRGYSFVDYTGKLARLCSGQAVPGEFLVEYESSVPFENPADTPHLWDGWTFHRGSEYTIQAHVRTFDEILAQIFDPFNSHLPMDVGANGTINGHSARALIKRHVRTQGEPAELDVMQVQDWWWIDLASLYIVRWELRTPNQPNPDPYDFTHEPTLKLRPPDLPVTLAVPICVK